MWYSKLFIVLYPFLNIWIFPRLYENIFSKVVYDGSLYVQKFLMIMLFCFLEVLFMTCLLGNKPHFKGIEGIVGLLMFFAYPAHVMALLPFGWRKVFFYETTTILYVITMISLLFLGFMSLKAKISPTKPNQ